MAVPLGVISFRTGANTVMNVGAEQKQPYWDHHDEVAAAHQSKLILEQFICGTDITQPWSLPAAWRTSLYVLISYPS